MTNFVLMDLPNFIVVGSPSQTSSRHSGRCPEHLNTDFADVLDLLGAQFDTDPLSTRIRFNERGLTALRGVIDRFGFERLPDTYAELYGLFDYCDRLTAISGIGMLPPGELAGWQGRSFLLLSDDKPPFRPVVEMYCGGNLEGLRAWHQNSNTLCDLGRAYRQLL